jgi:hypothetical protein
MEKKWDIIKVYYVKSVYKTRLLFTLGRIFLTITRIFFDSCWLFGPTPLSAVAKFSDNGIIRAGFGAYFVNMFVVNITELF